MENKDSDAALYFIFPKEGSPIWVDSLAIPATADNPAAAHRFIDFVLRPDNMAKLSEKTGHPVAGKEASAMLSEKFRAHTGGFPAFYLLRAYEVETTLPQNAAKSLEKRWFKINAGM